ncbi:MAG: non-homologous end-joining DNA ligase [Nocardioidaceae bacterium]
MSDSSGTRTNRGSLDIDGRTVRVSNLDKVLYAADGTTKGDVINHYIQVADVILPLIADRPATRKRWPDGVDSQSFFEKNVPRGTPIWIRAVTLDSPGSSKERDTVTYPVLEDLAALVWAGNLAALELHVPQWRVGPRGGVRNPDRLVIDLDPGAPAGLAECVEAARAIRERLADDGLDAVPVTSGSKGLQLYAPISARQSGDVVRDYAHRLAKALERDLPDLVVSRMAKALRPGKVLLDWSQNNPAKTTIAPYSLRGRERATVAAPRTWDELSDPGSVQQVHHSELSGRLESLGDPAHTLRGPGPTVPTR